MASGVRARIWKERSRNRMDRYAATAVTTTPRRIWPWMCAPGVPASEGSLRPPTARIAEVGRRPNGVAFR
jgi:hypothetical protein